MPITREQLIEAFRGRGYELWLVGGVLRDRLLGQPEVDRDYATDALPDTVEELALGLDAPVTTVGKKFGTIGVLVEGRWTEITTFRGDSYEGGTRWPDVRFGRTIEEDLARRDFTVNALAENALTGEVLDLYEGREDLERRVIRAVGEPELRFREDPLRILRGMRFASQLDFEVEEKTLEAMERTVALLTTLSQERITSELEKLLVGRNPARGLELVRTTGALDAILPELADMPDCEQNRFHRYDVWGPRWRRRRRSIQGRPAAPPLGSPSHDVGEAGRATCEGERRVGLLSARDGWRGTCGRYARPPPRSAGESPRTSSCSSAVTWTVPTRGRAVECGGS
jgi:tRNA nucleotidyltransferase/poly(A) polymerase